MKRPVDNAPTRAPARGRLLCVLLALASALCLAAPSPAHAAAEYSSSAGEYVHSSNDMTWEEWSEYVEENGEYMNFPDDDTWSDEWMSGEQRVELSLTKPKTYIPFITQAIYGAVESFCGTLTDLSEEMLESIYSFDGLVLDIDDDSYKEVYTACKTISTKAIEPIAVAFLAMALVIELLEFSRDVAQKNDHFAMLGSYVWILVKFALVMTLVGHTTLLTTGIYELFAMLANFIADLLSSTSISTGMFSAFMVSLQELTFSQAGVMALYALLSLVAVAVAAIVVFRVLITVVVRMFEIYIMTAFSGLPMVMLVNRQTRQGGLRYFQQYAGACLQAAVLIVTIAFAGSIVGSVSMLMSVPSTMSGPVAVVLNVLAPIAGMLAIGAMVNQSREFANRIVGT